MTFEDFAVRFARLDKKKHGAIVEFGVREDKSLFAHVSYMKGVKKITRYAGSIEDLLSLLIDLTKTRD